MDYDMKAIFTSVVPTITDENNLINQLWREIELAYNDENRYYHTMKHLQHMYAELLYVKQYIRDWNTIIRSLFYHDIVYNPTRTDNELKSAELAKAHLKLIQLPDWKIEKCIKMILATKDHSASEDEDTNYFTDADLSILGSNRSVYIEYCKDIRKEYSVIPDAIYKPARKTVLTQFAKMPGLFKTKYFNEKYEKIARENVGYELNTL